MLFDVAIVAVTMDLAEHHLFCGGSDGSIFQVDLCTWVSGQVGEGGAWARAGVLSGPWDPRFLPPRCLGPPG